MTAATFVQTNFTTQDAATYKASIDADVAVLSRSGAAFAPHAQSTPDMTVRVDAGFLLYRGLLVTQAAQSTGAITAPASNPRIDRVVGDVATGAVSVVTGTEAGSPSAPAVPAGKFPIAQVALATSTTAITNSLITDERAMPASAPLPRGTLSGFVMANSSTADVSVGAGCARDSSDAADLYGSALTKLGNTNWAAGNNQGGMFQSGASFAAGTTYHLFAVRKDSDASVDYGWDTSATAANKPSGYTYYRRLMSFKCLTNNVLVPFYQDGDDFLLGTPVQDVNTTNPGTSAVLSTLSTPSGVRARARLSLRIEVGSTTTVLYASSPDQADVAASNSSGAQTVGAEVASTSASVPADVWTDASSQVRYRLSASDASVVVKVNTHGWRDERGK